MQVGDLVKIKKGCFMGGKMGIIVSKRLSSHEQQQYSVQFIGNIPKDFKDKLVLYREYVLTSVKSSSGREQ